MNDNKIYTNSILTFAFTNEGKIIIRKDKDQKIDSLPLIFLGYRKKDCKTDYEDSIWIMNNMDEYKERIATFFAYHLRNCRNAILNGYFVGNGNTLLDVGEFHKKIANQRIAEMKKLHTPSFIRVKTRSYDGGIILNNRQVVNKIEIRYIILPKDEDMERFPDLEAKELEELKNDFPQLSNKMILGITGENGQIIESFINRIKTLNKCGAKLNLQKSKENV